MKKNGWYLSKKKVKAKDYKYAYILDRVVPLKWYITQ